MHMCKDQLSCLFPALPAKRRLLVKVFLVYVFNMGLEDISIGIYLYLLRYAILQILHTL